jgi:hypothetical protein
MEETAPVEMKWKVCPATLQPWKGALAWLAIIGTVVMIFDVNAIAGISTLVFWLGTMGIFIFPSTYTIDSKGIYAKHPLSAKYYTWGQVRRTKFFNDSCYLFTRKKASVVGSGMRVFFGNQGKQISSAIKGYLSEDIAT